MSAVCLRVLKEFQSRCRDSAIGKPGGGGNPGEAGAVSIPLPGFSYRKALLNLELANLIKSFNPVAGIQL